MCDMVIAEGKCWLCITFEFELQKVFNLWPFSFQLLKHFKTKNC